MRASRARPRRRRVARRSRRVPARRRARRGRRGRARRPARGAPRSSSSIGDGATAMLPDGTGRAAVPWLSRGDTGSRRVAPRVGGSRSPSARTGNRELYVVDIATGASSGSPGRVARGRRAGLVAGRLAGRLGERDGVEPRSPCGSGSTGADSVGSRAVPADDREPAWSPDGRSVAFASNEQGAFDLLVVPPRGRCEEPAPRRDRRGARPDWHPSGRRSPTRASSARTPTSGWRARRDVPELLASAAYDGRPDWSPDGRSIGFLRGRGTLRPWLLARADATPARSPRRTARRAGAGLGAHRRLGGACSERAAPGSRPAAAERSRRTWRRPRTARPRLHVGDGQPRPRACLVAGSASGVREPMLVQQLVRHESGGIDTLRGVGRAPLRAPPAAPPLAPRRLRAVRASEPRRRGRRARSQVGLLPHRPLGLRAPASRPPAAAAALRRRLRHAATDALRVEEGSSVGYTDRYPAFFHGQDLELTGAAGRPVRARADREPRAPPPGARLREQRRLGAPAASWPAGRRSRRRGSRCSAAAAASDGASRGGPTARRAGAYDQAGWSASTSSSSVPVRPAPRRRSTSPAPARACCSPRRRGSRATSRAAAG